MATCLAGLDLALVSTAMPTVAAQLGGLDLYAWTFSSYLLSSTIAVPVYGKLADRYGRKPLFVLASTIFLIGSTGCGAAQSMPQLIAARLLQGLGGGGLYPLVLTIVGDVFGVQQRARVLGLLSAIWGISAVLGPALGGAFTEHLTWRLAFLVQLPLGLAAMLLIGRFVHDMPAEPTPGFDWPGTVLLAAATTALLVGVQVPGWTPAAFAAALLAVVFLFRERAATDPLIRPGLVTIRAVAVGTAVSVLVGVVLSGAQAFEPPLLQGVMKAAPTISGLTLSCMSISWPIASLLSGRILPAWGYRWVGALGALFLVIGFLALRAVESHTSLEVVVVIQLVLGAGFGFTTPVALLVMQNSVAWTERGVVTGLNQLAVMLGGALGVAAAGALFGTAVRAEQPLEAALGPIFMLFVGTAAVSLLVMLLLPHAAAPHP